MQRNLIVVILLASLGLAANAVAEDDLVDVLPAAQVLNGIEFRVGGVGLDERDALRTVLGDYNLWLSFARRGTSAYAADTEVVIRDAHGNVVLEVLAEGPWLMAKLPAGHYRVSARQHGGDVVTQRVTVRDRGLARHVLQVREPDAG